jgi:hypothetical protein
MPKGMQPIFTRTLSNITYTVTFSNIPQTYTDLMILISGRSDFNGAFDGGPSMFFNGLGSLGNYYSDTRLIGDGSSATSARTSDAAIYLGHVPAATATANSFSNHEIYIPNYRSGSIKSVIFTGAAETSATTAYVNMRAGTARIAFGAITSIGMYGGAGNWVAGSTFTLYGISR